MTHIVFLLNFLESPYRCRLGRELVIRLDPTWGALVKLPRDRGWP